MIEGHAFLICVDFNIYTNGSASGGLIDGEAFVVVTREGKPNFAYGCEDHMTDRCLFHLFLKERKEGPGGSGTLVTNGPSFL